MTQNEIRYNKGEWSELYAFLKILVDGIILSEDSEGITTSNSGLEVVKIHRKSNNLSYFYTIGPNIDIYCGDEKVDSIPKETVIEYCNKLGNGLINTTNKSKGTFHIEGSGIILENFRLSNVTANSRSKEDIDLVIRNSIDGQIDNIGLSIKSFVGSKPTLMNAGRNTRVRYKILGMTDDLMDSINSINSENFGKDYIKHRFETLFASREVNLSYSDIPDKSFKRNLQLIDTIMPKIIAYFMLYHYRKIDESCDCAYIINGMENENLLDLEDTVMYKKKFKEFLVASALGMTPGKLWDGENSATGGYIIVKKDGTLRYHSNQNPTKFSNYLLNRTKIDRPSLKRHKFGFIFKFQEDFYIDLNIQIRFK